MAMKEVNSRFNCARHPGVRVSLSFTDWNTGPSGLLAFYAPGLDLTAYLNVADVAALRDACDKVLAMFPAPATEEKEAA